MTNILLAPSSRSSQPIQLMNTALDSLANNAAAISSSAMPNATSLDLYVWFELLVTFASAPTANTTLDLYAVGQMDGTNYEDATAGASPILPPNGFIGSFPVRAVTTQQRIHLGVPGTAQSPLLVPPLDVKLLLYNNNTGQALAGSGVNFLKGYFYHLSAS